MRSRAEVARFINRQLDPAVSLVYRTEREKGSQFHYGRQELRELMDFIYGGLPADRSEEIDSGKDASYLCGGR